MTAGAPSPKGGAGRGQSPVGNGGAGETGVVRDNCEGGEGGEGGAIGVRRNRVDNSQANRVDNFRESVPVLVLLGCSN